MSVDTDLTTLLKGRCDRVFPDFAPVGTPRPYVTYQQIGGQVINLVANEVPSKQNGEFQINVWADTRIEARELANQVEADLIEATVFQARPLGALVAAADPDNEIYGTHQDFSIWSNRT